MRSRASGLTLVELVISAGLLAVGILTLFSLVLVSQRAERSSTERTIARERAHGRLADLRARLRDQTGFDQQAQDLVTTQDGATDTTVLLQSQASLRTVFFRSASGLNEVAANAALGPYGVTNVDINGDGDTTDADVPWAEVRLVPVVVHQSWRTNTWTPATPDARDAAPGHDGVVTLAALLY